MKVFISWSGDRSRRLAEFLAGWLKKLPLAIEPWVSKDAIEPGTRWGKELAEALEGTSFGILCITSENQREAWINFEAGALSKTIEKSHVVPYLIGMKPPELEQPLKQFQASEASEEDTWKLIETIYMVSEDKTRTISDLEDTFKVWWPRLAEQIDILKGEPVAAGVVNQEPNMTDIKASLDKVSTVLESLSARMIKWESERFSLGNAGLGVRGYTILQNRLKDELSRISNIRLADFVDEETLKQFAKDPITIEKKIKELRRLLGSSDENEEVNK